MINLKMKANELRIGNYLRLPTRDAKVVIIEEILRGDYISCNITTNEWPIRDYEPIPLTEEWLLKFGAHNYPSRKDLFNVYGYSVYLSQETILFYIGTRGIEIKYVHQLQNLYFALTGKELTTNPTKEENQ